MNGEAALCTHWGAAGHPWLFTLQLMSTKESEKLSSTFQVLSRPCTSHDHGHSHDHRTPSPAQSRAGRRWAGAPAGVTLGRRARLRGSL